MSAWFLGADNSWSLSSDKAKKAICWLHGLGASSADFKEFVNAINQYADIGCNWYLPQADNIAVTINNGYVMPAWYDIYSLTDFSQQDIKGMQVSAEKLAKWVDMQHARGISAENVSIVGFSQGGA